MDKAKAKTSIEQGDRKIEQKEFDLSRSKDRAQSAATIASSVVQVTLLKEVIESGPERPYFILSLTLISLALTLQVLAGVIGICLQNIDNHYKRYRGDICGDICNGVCCCCSAAVRGSSGCFGCIMCTCSSMSYFDERIVEDYDTWAKEYAEVQKELATETVDMKYIDLKITELESRVERNPTVTSKYALDSSRALMRGKEFMVEEEQLHEHTGKFLQDRADTTIYTHAIKKMTVWQQIINYILYIVFVLNAFITAFGVAT